MWAAEFGGTVQVTVEARAGSRRGEASPWYIYMQRKYVEVFFALDRRNGVAFVREFSSALLLLLRCAR